MRKNSCDNTKLAPPATHGEILLRPNLKQIFDDISANRQVLGDTEIQILSEPFNKWRSLARQELLSLVQNYSRQIELPVAAWPWDRPLIVTGHQCEFFHCGVLMKIILTCYMARQSGGIALNLVVDNDLPKNYKLKVPVKSQDNKLHLKELEMGRSELRLPMEYQSLPRQAQLDQFLFELDQLEVTDGLRDRLIVFANKLTEIYCLAQNKADLYTLITHSMTESLGLNWIDLPVSTLAESEAFLAFAVDLLLRAALTRRFNNEALAWFRQKHRIRSNSHPMPDLAGGKDAHDWQEVPLWLFCKDQQRTRLFARRDNSKLIAGDGQNELFYLPIDICRDRPAAVLTLKNALKKYNLNLHLRPRALSLTAFTRLFLADMFVHGIGGAGYDEVTDHFIRAFYQIEPPAYACCSATAYLPEMDCPDVALIKKELRHLQHRQRDSKFNPQRLSFSSPDDNNIEEKTNSEELTKLMDQRRKAVAFGEQLRQNNASSDERRKVFACIRDINERIAEAQQGKSHDLAREIKQKEEQLRQANIAHDRTYFFGLFPETELKQLKQQIEMMNRQ